MANLFRVRFLIDGFNVYHSLRQKYRKYLWLNYKALAEAFVRDDQVLEGVYYFTAIAHWLQGPAQRHQLYLHALDSEGVHRVLGRFKEKDRYCPLCRKVSKGHEEKQTDVNIALHLLRGAYRSEFDTAVLVTNDTDLVPAIRIVKEDFPDLKVGVVFPLGRASQELKGVVDFFRYLKPKHLKRSQLPHPYPLSIGKMLSKPREWS